MTKHLEGLGTGCEDRERQCYTAKYRGQLEASFLFWEDKNSPEKCHPFYLIQKANKVPYGRMGHHTKRWKVLESKATMMS